MIKLSVKKSRLWIPAAGFVLAFGFFNNCIVLPWLEGGEAVDWMNLILTFAILLGLGGARDVVLRKFRYLGPVVQESQKSQSKGVWNNRTWIPIVGWCLVGGLFNNCCIHPFFNVGEVEWGGLMSALSIMLTVSGAREWGIYSKDKQVLEDSGTDEETAETDAEGDTSDDSDATESQPVLRASRKATHKFMPKSHEFSDV